MTPDRPGGPPTRAPVATRAVTRAVTRTATQTTTRAVIRAVIRAASRIAAAILLLASLLTPGCGGDAVHASPPRLVLLYAPCTVNRALLSPYDASIPFTPHLDRFAGESLVFERHVTEAGQSGIAYASIFTGGQATLHGVYAHPRHVPEELTTLPEAFRDAGYDTFFWGGQRMAVASLDGQGVEPANTFDEGLKAADPVFRGVLERLAAEPDYRALVMTAFTMTHAPYKPHGFEAFCAEYPEQCAGALKALGGRFEELHTLYQQNYIELSYDWSNTVDRLGLDPGEQDQLVQLTNLLYRARVEKLDAAFGRVLRAIEEAGLDGEALVVFTADHGEVMDRENALFRWTHGHALAPEVLGVPLIVRAPSLGIRAGRHAGVTRSMDLLPTLAGLCDLDLTTGPPPEGFDLSADLLGGTEPHLLGYSHTSLIPHGAPPDVFGPAFEALYPRDDPAFIWVGIRDGERIYKYRNVGDGTFACEVFDHASDPGETRNLYDAEDAEHAAMLARLEEYKAALVADHEARRQAGDTGNDLSAEEQLEALKSLGYVR